MWPDFYIDLGGVYISTRALAVIVTACLVVHVVLLHCIQRPGGDE